MSAGQIWASIGVVIVALAVSVLAGMPLASGVLRRAGAAEVNVGGDAVLRGGRWIGILERTAVTGTLLAGYPAGIAVVVAIKGLGRYPELAGAMAGRGAAAERFIIGTLTSLLWASAVGLGGAALLGAVSR